jgi:hypothetical protein
MEEGVPMGLSVSVVNGKYVNIAAQNIGSNFRMLIKCANLMFC